MSELKEWVRRRPMLIEAIRKSRALLAPPMWTVLRRARRPLRRFEIDAYLRTHAVRKLHLGADNVELPGWLNTEYAP